MIDNEIDVLRRCKIDPFGDYSAEELETILKDKEKSWRRASQDPQKSESERKTLEEYCEVVDELLNDEEYFEEVLDSAQCIFSDQFNEELKKSCVLRSDGEYSISEGIIEGVADKIIKGMGWAASYNADMVDTDVILYEGKTIYRDFRNVFTKLKRINPEYVSVEDWLNDLIGMEKLRVEGCHFLAQDCSFHDFKNTVGKIQERFKKNAYKEMVARQNHAELLNLIETCVTSSESGFDFFRTYSGLRTTFEVIDQAYSMGRLNDLASVLRGIKVRPGTGNLVPYIEDYFLEKGYSFDFYSLDGCILSCSHCGAVYRDDGDITTCSKCGNTLFIKCSNCGVRCSSDDEFCSVCGHENINKEKLVSNLRSKYESAIRMALFDEALESLKEIEKVEARYVDLTELKMSLKEKKDQYNKIYSELNECRRKKAINEAYRLCSILKDGYPDSVTIDDMMNDLEKTRSKVDSLLFSVSNEQSMVNNYVAASQICTDDHRITDFLRDHPPKPPRSIDVAISDDAVRISIVGPPSISNTVLAIVRKMNAPPLTPDDGVCVSIGQCDLFEDRSLTPGIEYYYSAFSIRGGIASSGINSKRVIFLPRASSLVLKHLPDCIFGEMSIPKEATGIQVSRSEGDNGRSISISIQDGKGRFEDTSVMAGRTYTYSISVQYGIRSSNCIFQSYALPYLPTIDLSIRRNGKQFCASVFDSGPFEIIISDNKISLPKNYLMTDKVEQYYKPKLIRGNFAIPDGYLGFAYALRNMGNYFVLSNPVKVSSIYGVDDVEYQVYRNECTLMFSPPAKSKAILVKWSTKKMLPNSMDEDSKSLEVPIDVFKYNGNKIKLPVDGRIAYVEIKVSYGGGRVSDGYHKTIPITKPILEYSISFKKRLFSNNQSAIIKFRNDWGASVINGLVIGIGARVAPRAIDEAERLISIPELKFQDGVSEFSFQIEKEQIPMIRVFKSGSGTEQDFSLRKE